MNNCDSEAVGEVAVDTLKPYDFIVIKTVNSTYRFLAVDPAKRRGLLMGGVCGRTVVASVLYFPGYTRVRGQSFLSRQTRASRPWSPRQ